jgi:hypothetical protein
MNELAGKLLVAALAATPPVGPAPDAPVRNWCTPGYTVMVPDGREAWVSSVDGEICRVIADGEKYVTLMPHFILEPVYPQTFPMRAYR